MGVILGCLRRGPIIGFVWTYFVPREIIVNTGANAHNAALQRIANILYTSLWLSLLLLLLFIHYTSINYVELQYVKQETFKGIKPDPLFVYRSKLGVQMRNV